MSWILLLLARLLKSIFQWGYFAIPRVIGPTVLKICFEFRYLKVDFCRLFHSFLPRLLLTWLTGSHRESFVQPITNYLKKTSLKSTGLHYGNQPSWDLLLIKAHYNTHLCTWRAFVLPHNFSRKILYGPTKHRTI